VLPFEHPDLAPYFNFNPGVSPARENVATDEQRRIFNTVAHILDTAELAEANQPYEAAAILANVEQFVQKEEDAFEEKKGELSKGAIEWRKDVQRMRKHYRDAKRKSKLLPPPSTFASDVTVSKNLIA